MISRVEHAAAIRRLSATFPVVALLGPRQVGKTTLAFALAEAWDKPSLYLDLERDSDRNKLLEPELFLSTQAGKLVILDEVQRQPELFPLLRSLVDERVRGGEAAGHFLVLGSASRDLLQQSSESLAGRIAYHELPPLSSNEVFEEGDQDQHWLRGGFPRSYLAQDEPASWEWRGQFISTYLERDIPQLGVRLPTELVRRLWMMLALGQGASLNVSRLATSLDVDGKTVRRYLDLLTELYMVRQLQPWSGNSSKRLVKSPKVYVRDSGLVHRLATLPDMQALLGHSLCGASWEGFALEQILGGLTDTWRASYYRTASGAEVDLVLEGASERILAIEIKRTRTPKPSRGFLSGSQDVGAAEKYFVVPGAASYPLGHGILAVGIEELADALERPA